MKRIFLAILGFVLPAVLHASGTDTLIVHNNTDYASSFGDWHVNPSSCANGNQLGIGGVAAHSTATFTRNDGYNQPVYEMYACYTNSYNEAHGVVTMICAVEGAQQPGNTWNVYIGAVTNPPCYTNLVWNVKNSDSISHIYLCRYLNEPDDVPVPPENWSQLSPGVSHVFSMTVPCGDTNLVGCYRSTGVSVQGVDGSLTDGTRDPVLIAPTGSNSVSTVTADQNPSGATYNGSGATGTNSPILWQPGTTTNMVLAVQQGSTALYDAINKFGQQAHSDAQTMIGELGDLGGLTNVAQESTLRGLAGTATNILNALNGLSNSTSWTTNKTTNSYASLSGQMLGMMSGTATNASAAQAAAETALGDYGADGLISQLTPNLPPESVGEPNMTMLFCGQTIDLDPVHQFPTVAYACLTGFRIVLLLAFLIEVGRMFWNIAQTMSQTSTGGIPNMDIFAGVEALTFGGTFGGNLLGMAVAILIPFAFIAIFSVVLIWFFAHLGISISDAMNISAFSSSLGNIGFYLLSSFFPVSLFFSLICTRIILQFTLARMVVLAASATRFLFGK